MGGNIMIYDTMEKAQNLHTMLCIYTNQEDTSSFSLGYIQNMTNSEVLIESINSQGNYDGYIVKNIKDIFLIEENNKYIQKVTFLHDKSNTPHKNISNKYKNLFKSLLYFAKSYNLIVSVQLHYSNAIDIQGYVGDIEENEASFLCVDDYGLNDGKAICDINDITILACDGEDEMSLKILSSIDQSKEC